MKNIINNKKSKIILLIVFIILTFCAWQFLTPKHNVFVKGPNMHYPRYGCLATSLKDGNVLITGGKTLSKDINIGEIYNFKTNKFEIVGKMNTNRLYHNATSIETGEVLITGGEGGRYTLAYAEMFNPKTRKFKLLKNMNEHRSGHKATLLKNGNVLITGGLGINSILSSAEIYEVNKNKFIKIPNMNYPRVGHTATLLNNGNVLIVGGNSKTSNGEIYDIKSNKFELTNPMKYPREGGHTTTLLKDGRVLIIGGFSNNPKILSTIEIFDENTKKFKYIGDLEQQREGHRALLLNDELVFLTGGTRPCSWAYCPMKQAKIIAIQPEFEIKNINNMKIARSGHNMNQLKNGDILITSGNGNNYTTEIFKH